MEEGIHDLLIDIVSLGSYGYRSLKSLTFVETNEYIFEKLSTTITYNEGYKYHETFQFNS